MATYCTASGVKAYLNDSAFSSIESSGDFPSNSIIEDWIEIKEDKIDGWCDRTFKEKTSQVEYYDHDQGNILLVDNYPIISISELGELQSDWSYEALTKTRNEDTDSSYYIKDSEAGKIHLNDPIYDEQAYKLTYTYGYTSSTRPKWIKELCKLMTAKKVLSRILIDNDDNENRREWTRFIDDVLQVEIDELKEMIERRFRTFARGV